MPTSHRCLSQCVSFDTNWVQTEQNTLYVDYQQSSDVFDGTAYGVGSFNCFFMSESLKCPAWFGSPCKVWKVKAG